MYMKENIVPNVVPHESKEVIKWMLCREKKNIQKYTGL